MDILAQSADAKKSTNKSTALMDTSGKPATVLDGAADVSGEETEDDVDDDVPLDPNAPFVPCPECHKKCANEAAVLKHMRVHIRVKKFICQECFKKFKGGMILCRCFAFAHKKSCCGCR